MGPKRSSGFTLMEILITVALVAVLAAIAIPQYSAYIVRGQRAAAKAGLEQAAQFLERNYTTYGCYDYDTTANACATTAALPNWYSPSNGRATYAITAALAGQNYVLTATPCGAGATCPAGSETTFNDTQCGALTLDNTGAQGAGGTAGTVTCWQR